MTAAAASSPVAAAVPSPRRPRTFAEQLARVPLGAVMRLARYLHALPRRQPSEPAGAYRGRVHRAILRARRPQTSNPQQ